MFWTNKKNYVTNITQSSTKFHKIFPRVPISLFALRIILTLIKEPVQAPCFNIKSQNSCYGQDKSLCEAHVHFYRYHSHITNRVFHKRKSSKNINCFDDIERVAFSKI